MISKSDKQIIRLATGPTNCGSVISRPTFSFKSGSNGLAMYATKCSYTNVNKQNLPTLFALILLIGLAAAYKDEWVYWLQWV